MFTLIRTKMSVVILLLVLIAVVLSPLLFVRSVSYADYSSNCRAPSGTSQDPICNGGACNCYVPYAGRGGHIWVGIPVYGQFITQCMTTWKSGCCDFC